MMFRAMIQLGGTTATCIQVPPEVITALRSSERPPVRATINGHTYRSSVASVGGMYTLPVSAQVREGAGVAAGDEVDVEIELDTVPREVTVPPDFADAIGRDADAKRSFDALAYSHKQRHVLAVEGARTAATRQRRIAEAVERLRGGGA